MHSPLLLTSMPSWCSPYFKLLHAAFIHWSLCILTPSMSSFGEFLTFVASCYFSELTWQFHWLVSPCGLSLESFWGLRSGATSESHFSISTSLQAPAIFVRKSPSLLGQALLHQIDVATLLLRTFLDKDVALVVLPLIFALIL